MKDPHASLLASLDLIAAETVTMLDVLEDATLFPDGDRREIKRRVLELRGKSHELFNWLAEVRPNEPRN